MNPHRNTTLNAGTRLVSLAIVAAMTATGAIGCSDSGGSPTGTAGTSGAAGTGGSTGTAGTGGSSGTAGTGGATGDAGATGTGGSTTGTAGTGGSSGTAGTGGSGTAGTTGSGGTGGSGTAGTTGTGGGTAGTGGSGTAGTGGAGGDPLIAAGLTAAEAAAARTLGPLPAVPANPTNMYADNAGAATLGQKLFFDKRYSGALAITEDVALGGLGTMGDTGKIACASCHAGRGLDDRRSKPGNVSLGADYLSRNSLPIVNSSFYKWTNWAGRFAAQWELPIAVVENAKNMNGDRLRVVHLIYDKYKADYEAVFGALDAGIADTARFPASAKPKASGAADGPWEMMAAADQAIANRVFVNFAKALEAYMRKIVSRNAPLDRFIAGNVTALGDDEIRGLKLFVGSAGCIQCHSGPTMADGAFHNIGVSQTGSHVPTADNGRFADVPGLVNSGFNVDGMWSDDRTTGRLTGLTATPPDTDKGLFRTASLRGIAETAPYMHAGQLATLEDVVAFYDRGGDPAAVGTKDPKMVPLGLSTRDRADLAAFLRALTGDAVPAALLMDTSAP